MYFNLIGKVGNKGNGEKKTDVIELLAFYDDRESEEVVKTALIEAVWGEESGYPGELLIHFWLNMKKEEK